MSQDLWTAVDAYITETLVQPDAIFAKALAENAKEGLPAIDVAPNQGKLLHILALIQVRDAYWRSAHSAATALFGWLRRSQSMGG